MRRRRTRHLNELMIVNPGRPDRPRAVYLGRDGFLHRAPGLGDLGERPPSSRYFLSDDGLVFELRGQGLGALPPPPGQLLLGEDGTLYEIVE